MPMERKYAKPEWERRFLLSGFPSAVKIQRTRKIVDRYIAGTTLRLRRQIFEDGVIVLKLTQKLPFERNGALRGMITTMYLTEREFDVFTALAATLVTKTRYSVPPLGIDVFDGELSGLVLAEAEFNSASEASEFKPPSFVVHEITSDDRFEGGSLAAASRGRVEAWVEEYGIAFRTS